MTSSLPVQHRFLSALERHPVRLAVAIILASFFVRLWLVASGQLNLAQDEAQYWDWSRRLQLSYYSKGPLIAWFIGGWTSLFGDTELGVRIGAVFNATLAQIMLYLGLARLMKRPRLAVLALIVAGTMPLFLASGVLMTTDNILVLCWLGAIFCLYALTSPSGHRSKRHSPTLGWPLLLLALCMAVGNLAKYMMLAFFAVAIPYFWLLHRHRLLAKGTAVKALASMAVGACIGYIPILVWNMQNGWVGFLHVSSLAGLTGSGAARIIRLDTMPEFLAGQLGVATPWWLLLMLFTGWRYARAAWRGRVERDDPLRQASPAEQVRQTALLACGFWPLWLGMLLWSFHARIYANWPGMSYITGIMLAAAGLERLLAGFGTPRARRFALVWPSLGLVVFLLIFGQHWLPLPPAMDVTMRLRGWSDLGQKLEALTAEFPDPSKVFYFASNYDATAELAFYGPGQPEAYSVNFGRRLSQYDLWQGPTDPASAGGDKTGWDAIYINAKGDIPPELNTMFDKVTPMTYTSTHQGKTGRTFAIVLLQNFNGRWPHSDHERY